MWVFSKDIPVEKYETTLVDVKDWKEVKSSPTILILPKKIIDGIKKVSSLFIEKLPDVPSSFYRETISFRKDGFFIKEADFTPKVVGLWNLNEEDLIVSDDEIADKWGGENWFNTRKEIVRLTDKHLILKHEGYYIKYIPAESN